MKDILAPENLEALAELTRRSVLIAFDFDGTLAPIVDNAEEALIPPSTRALLEEVAHRYPCIVISGRSQSDALKRLRGIPLREVIGNHGLEPWQRTSDFAERVQRWVEQVTPALADLPGVHLEDKVFSLAIHYRKADNRTAAREGILRAVSTLPGSRLIGGKLVVNVLPEEAPNKGTALVAARERLGCEVALFVGDDDTDEDVFALSSPEKLVGVRVGQVPLTRAAYFVDDQAQIDSLLGKLLQVRASPTAPLAGTGTPVAG